MPKGMGMTYSAATLDYKLKSRILVAIASGLSIRVIAKQFNVAPGTVAALRHHPSNQAILAAHRVALQDQLSNVLPDAVQKAKVMVDTATDHKDLDAATRALLNLEKVSASVAGQRANQGGNTTVQIAIAPGWGAPVAQAKVLEGGEAKVSGEIEGGTPQK